MEIKVMKDYIEKNRFGVEIHGDLSFVISAKTIFFTLNAEQLDKLAFQAQAELQDSEKAWQETAKEFERNNLTNK